ncbi:uncharacterized protein MELLADRAFT_107378 [Melampsora larici-populina 98AG31]|uniref:Uncharacterized protein n=1 Tax=Melampsora larici-populina (strain 98AG31 / pathotype 3-4-7) TaxID=747676 RepID=F4RPL0_MELLP|nr:uncharacterized protein MELLADRAFT_107378 [Melampsora larici-populina 98AG31]EGG05552.1 hypothetical protein MELLADRAFT_107378 [Melampsora larici-populina 98AG31]
MEISSSFERFKTLRDGLERIVCLNTRFFLRKDGGSKTLGPDRVQTGPRGGRRRGDGGSFPLTMSGFVNLLKPGLKPPARRACQQLNNLQEPWCKYSNWSNEHEQNTLVQIAKDCSRKVHILAPRYGYHR